VHAGGHPRADIVGSRGEDRRKQRGAVGKVGVNSGEAVGKVGVNSGEAVSE
jgi:hypothetical protein